MFDISFANITLRKRAGIYWDQPVSGCLSEKHRVHHGVNRGVDVHFGSCVLECVYVYAGKSIVCIVNSSPLGQNGPDFADIFRSIFVNGMLCIFI